MKERIKAIADQMFSMEEFEYAEEFLNDAFMEKFAELIVRECIKSIRPYDASGHFEETIREHFYGVEE